MCVPFVEQLAQLDEPLTGPGGDRGGTPMVRRRRRHQRRTLAAAECSGDRSTRSGVGGCRRRSRGAVGVRGDRTPDPSLRERRRRLRRRAVAVRGGPRRGLARHRHGVGAARLEEIGAGVARDRRGRHGAAGRCRRATRSSCRSPSWRSCSWARACSAGAPSSSAPGFSPRAAPPDRGVRSARGRARPSRTPSSHR